MFKTQQQIIAAATAGALVLTVNKRLARHLIACYDQQMLEAGSRAWQTATILSFEGWLQRSLAELDESWRLLEGFPALRLWEQLIEQASRGSELELLQISATARKAQEAHQWSIAYGLSLDGQPLTEDQLIFRSWQADYQAALQKHQWIDRAELSGRLYAAMAAGELPVPKQVLLVGFDQWSPELDGLQQLLTRTGGQLTEIQQQNSPDSCCGTYACPDPTEEVERCARWVRHLLDQGATSIGVVVPDLQARRAEIERIFRQQIDPAADLQLQDEETAFSLSLGAPLADQGPVYAALQLLGCGFRPTTQQIGYLLRCPYLAGSQGEADARARFDGWLRSFRQQRLSLKNVSRLAAEAQRAPGAGQIFEQLSQALENRERLLPGEWAGRFSQLLQTVGWPGERSLASSEYQMVKAWQEKLLPALASLDLVSPPLDRQQAVSLLNRLAQEIEFQLEAPTGPVQVVGLLESAGLNFDHLWVLGCNEGTFPAVARPNPFLPVAIQVEKGMPHASAERELQFARGILQRLQAASDDVIFSYARRHGDCELRPSPLLCELPVVEPVLAERQDAVCRQMATAPDLEILQDTQGPPLVAERGEGGTAILKDQALCPFRAFAHFRLRASAFEQPQPGLDPLTRGNLIHKALESFWSEVKDQQQLLQLDEQSRDALLVKHVSCALDDYFSEQGAPPARLLQIEEQRLQALLAEWLAEVEVKRGPFSVLETEQEHFEQIGPLKIRTFIDRIDQLADGSRVVLDYKTGQINADALLAARLLEPQLPIYAVADSHSEADGVAFAQLRRGDCKLAGIARDADLLPKVPGVANSKQAIDLELGDWSQVLAHWRKQLEQLANDFVAGEAAVDPVSVEIACRYCDLPGLCRISEGKPELAFEEGGQ